MDAVPEIFVDRLGEVALKEGLIRIELVSLSGPEPRVTQRLIMSVQAFLQMLQVQHNMVQSLERAGILTVQPAAPAGPVTTTGAAAPSPAMTPPSHS
jgi:hypothetical protein